jgi:hypothetical protein
MHVPDGERVAVGMPFVVQECWRQGRGLPQSNLGRKVQAGHHMKPPVFREDLRAVEVVVCSSEICKLLAKGNFVKELVLDLVDMVTQLCVPLDVLLEVQL